MVKLFTIGPVQLYQSTKEIRLHDFVHFRTDEFSEIVKNSLHDLSLMLGNTVPNSLIYIASSGTAAMEAVVENCVGPDDHALVINGGAFGHRFCELLEYHHRRYSSIDLKWNESLTAEHLNAVDGSKFTMLFVNLHETQTGQLYDIELLSDFCKHNKLLLIVDAISTFLADSYDMERYGIDLTIISSQKGLCLSPGMSFVSFSQRMLDKMSGMSPTASKYFDFKDYLVNIVRGQTPYTPPVLIMYELVDMLKKIKAEGGALARVEQVKKKAEYFRRKALEYGYSYPDYPLSNALTPLVLSDVDAYQLIQILKNDYRTFVNPCGGALAHSLLRVSHLGDTSLEDIDLLYGQIKEAIDKAKA